MNKSPNFVSLFFYYILTHTNSNYLGGVGWVTHACHGTPVLGKCCPTKLIFDPFREFLDVPVIMCLAHYNLFNVAGCLE